MSTQSLEQYYDELPYDFRPIAVTRPENLQGVAQIFGLKTTPLSSARILELGGASGGNIIPTALRFPGSTNVCMDLSGRQIRDGEELIEKCGGLPNLLLRQASITDIDESWGKFDYIICHGVFSWVPDFVQDAILRVCRENLTEDGVALISFNAYPGWKGREVVRDAMLFATQGEDSPSQRLTKARDALNDLRSMSDSNNVLKAVVEDVTPSIDNGSDSYILHEYLEPENSAFYFNDMITRASEAGLNYLGDSSIGTMFVENYPKSLQDAIRGNNITDPLRIQQYIDFGVNRTFRRALFVHADRKPAARMSPTALSEMHFVGEFTPIFDPQGRPVRGRVRDVRGTQYLAESPILLTIAEVVSQVYPASVSYQDMRKELQRRSGASMEQANQMMLPFMQMLVMKGGLAALGEPSQVASTLSATPTVPAFMRAQLKQQMDANPTAPRFVTWSLTHNDLALDPFGAWLATHLDGTRNVDDLVELALQAVAAGAKILPEGAGIVDRNTLRAQIPQSLESLRFHGVITK